MWSDADAAFVSTCPEFPGVSAFGDSPEEAVRELEVPVRLAIESCLEEGWALPEPLRRSEFSGQFRLRLPRSLHERLAIRAELEGVSLNALVAHLLSRAMGSARAGGASGRESGARLRRMP